MAKYDAYKYFRELSKEDQRENILASASMSIDGASVSLARKIEIYFDVTPEEQQQRARSIFRSLDSR